MTTRKTKTAKSGGSALSKMSLKELLEHRDEVDAAIAEARDRERVEVLSKMQELAASSGFSINELMGTGKGRGKGKSVSVAKYANPNNRAETWTGRGRKPNWLVEQLADGASLEDFAI